MPANKNALIRYKTIDRCLRNRFRLWTIDDLTEACSDALYEMEGITKGVSVRTVQGDLQIMRSDKLGYNAPIEVFDKIYYRYADPNYSINEMPLTEDDCRRRPLRCLTTTARLHSTRCGTCSRSCGSGSPPC